MIVAKPVRPGAQLTAFIAALLMQMGAPAVGWAQEPAAEPEEGAARIEAEFVGSTVFQSGLLSVGLESPLTFDAHYLGLDDIDAGIVGAAWSLSVGALRLLPGIGWGFTDRTRPAPMLMFRWAYDGEGWIGQGAFAVALRKQEVPDEEGGEPRDIYVKILDGAHISRVVGSVEVGPMVENIQYRDENEWKAGARAAVRFGRGLKAMTQLVWPDTELRVGLAWER